MNQDRMEELIEVQQEMLRWIRFTSIPQLKRTLEAVLVSSADKRIYELTNGDATSRSIAATLKVGKTTVAEKWLKWAQLGIIQRLSSGQYRRLCSLADVGIEIPESGEKPAEVDDGPS